MKSEIKEAAVESAADKIVKQSFLYDFYGELLTEHQRQIFEDFVWNNLSLSEIAQERQVSRQSVHDIIKRCDRLLEEYEQKLHLVEKFQIMKKEIKQIHDLVTECPKEEHSELLQKIQEISEELMKNL